MPSNLVVRTIWPLFLRVFFFRTNPKTFRTFIAVCLYKIWEFRPSKSFYNSPLKGRSLFKQQESKDQTDSQKIQIQKMKRF
ncbi:hypothetical protein DQM68_18210 [Leptospira mayottensis]|nr:hypothetical protein DQM68_18210 [Leptospira mayottensis]AZQ04006.1 hypothetical protein LEP1GSC190_18285 [Leptospira mayottensis 200901116]TGM89726.1 hypothetical protein EHR03_18685 [Leptospira mayottensis]